ncbi:glycosyltransferase [Micromonospora sp. KC606]|uniref:glycosyltransferase n=1 Tax=Micromonospora sp. KC606 TaxID=2530379 RepID=UPI001043C7AD|nr:glycosyltransferase [Micromonospora sp. KC606]TDC85959.1 glycosyltransferase [Micromonospora sp. KC606]
MKLLFCSLPAHDHLLELIPVAEAAKRCGHDVAIAVSERFAATVEALGIEHITAGPDWVGAFIDDLDGDVLPEDMEDFTQTFLAELFCGDAAIAMGNDVAKAIEDWNPDIVLRDTGELGGYLAAERAGLPHVTVGVLDFNGMMLGKGVVAALDLRRQEFGLPSDPDGRRQYAYGHINMLAPDFAPEELELPNVFTVRVDGVRRGDVLPAWVGELVDDERPLIYASFGTAASTIPSYGPPLAKVIAGMGGVDANVIVSTGKGLDWHGKEIMGGVPVPENVRVVEWVPQALLMRSIDMLLTHAGPATARQAIVNGVPVVAVPLLFDAFEIANRFEQHGMGVQLDWTSFTPEDVATAATTVLNDPKYKRAARRLQARTLTVPPIDDAAIKFLERIHAANPRR